MKLTIDAAPGEPFEKAAELLRALASDLAPASEFAKGVLDKLDEMAVEQRPPSRLRSPMLERIRSRARAIRDEQIAAMVQEIGAVIDAAGHRDLKPDNVIIDVTLEKGTAEDRAAAAVHEIVAGELILHHGMGYEAAHDVAAGIEREFRADATEYTLDAVQAFLEEYTEGRLEKGLGHKYLARLPTGNPKRPWKYIYKYRSSDRSGVWPEVVHYKEQITPGTAVKDAPSDHKGHWKVIEVGAGDKDIKVRHDESGEEKTFADASAFRNFAESLHRPATREAREAATARRGAEAMRALGVALDLHKALAGAAPTTKSVKAISDQWNRVANLASDGRMNHEELAKALDVHPTPSKTFKALRARYHALRDEVDQWAVYGTESSLGSVREIFDLRDPDRIKKALELKLLSDQLTYTSSRVVKWKVNASDIATALAKDLKGKPIGPQDVEAEISKQLKARYPYDARNLSRSRLAGVAIIWDYNARDLMKDPEARVALEALKNTAATRESLLFVHPDKRLPEDGHDHQRRQMRQLLSDGIQQLVRPPPRPPLYSPGYRHDASRSGLEEAIKSWSRTSAFEEDLSAHRTAAIWRLQDGADPCLTIELPRPASDESHKPGGKWKPAPTMTAPVSVLLKLAETEGGAHVTELRNAHADRHARLQKAIGAVEATIGDINALVHDAHETIFEAQHLSPEDREAIRKDHPSGQSWGIVYGILKRTMPADLEAANYTNNDATTRKAAEAKVGPIRAAIKRQIAQEILGRIKDKLGIKPDPIRGRERMKNATSDAVPKEQVAATLTAMEDLYAFADGRVLPETTLTIVPGDGRANAGKHGGITLYNGDFRDGQVIWHEYGHRIEHESRGITEAANALRDRRGASSTLDQMGQGYDGHEMTYKDEWWSQYIGKWYGHMASTEVLSMGVQELINDPAALLRRDKEHFLFTVAALAGKLEV